jgi:hypothetical protein
VDPTFPILEWPTLGFVRPWPGSPGKADGVAELDKALGKRRQHVASRTRLEFPSILSTQVLIDYYSYFANALPRISSLYRSKSMTASRTALTNKVKGLLKLVWWAPTT